jgi:parallel beta-helix repeat protein
MTAALRILACATLLLVASADRAAAQPACGDTLTASTTLTADLACTGTGLKVGADKITIDLGGFTLSGDNGEGDLGIDNGLGFDGVTIKNGTISSFDEGISIGGNAQKNVVTGVRIEFCSHDAIDLNDSDLGKVTKCTILNNDNGVQMGADATGNVLEKSVIIGHADAGTEVQGTGNVVQKNQFTANNNAVRLLNGPNRVVGNTVEISDGDGIVVDGGSGSEVSKNTVIGSTGDGMQVRNAAATLVTKNTLTGNGEIGVNLLGTSDDATVSKNTVRGNRVYGMIIEDATNVRVQGNTVTGSRSTGIFIVSPTTVVSKNEATANLGFGIRVSTTAIDGGGNEAKNNGDGECDGVVCKD